MADIVVKFVTRYQIPNEKVEIGKVCYCTDTAETFFDEDTISRVCLGTSVINCVSVDKLPILDPSEIGTCAVINNPAQLMVFTESLAWEKVNTRDEFVELIGTPERFVPHSLYKNGKLIAPRTLMSCVYDDTGLSIGEKVNNILSWIYNFNHNGIDASMIKTGILNIRVIPKTATMDFIIVKDEAEMLALTIDRVQNGDVVQIDSGTGKAYFVVDETKLGTDEAEDAFREFTTGSIPWDGIMYRPTSLELTDGAVGIVSMDTGKQLADTRLKMSIKLNMDHATNGILPVARGGTGNQTGTAPYVKMVNADTETINVTGKRSNNSMGYSSGVTIKGGVLSAKAINATNPSLSSSLQHTYINGRIVFRSNSADTDKTMGINFTGSNGLKRGITYDVAEDRVRIGNGESSMAIAGVGIDVALISKRFNLYDDATSSSIMSVMPTNTSSTPIGIFAHKPLYVCNTEFVICPGASNTGTRHLVLKAAQIGRRINTAGTGTTTSSVTAGVFENTQYVYAFRKNASTGDKRSDNIMILDSSGVDVNGTFRATGNSTINGLLTVTYDTSAKGYNIDGVVKQAVNSDKLGNIVANQYVTKADIKNGTAETSSVITSSSAPAGRYNCLWINTSTGVANYWNGSTWVNISSVWKNA